MNGVLSSIYITGSILGLLVVAAFVTQKNRSYANFLLISLVLLLSIDICIVLARQFTLPVDVKAILETQIVINLLFAPLLLLFLKSQYLGTTFSRSMLLHFIFFVYFQSAAFLTPILGGVFGHFTTEQSSLITFLRNLRMLRSVGIAILIAIYLAWCVRTIYIGRLQSKITSAFHNGKVIPITLTTALLVYLLIAVAAIDYPASASESFVKAMYGVLACLLLVLAYGFLRKAFLPIQNVIQLEPSKEKYGSNRLPEFVKHSIISGLTEYMNESRPWLKLNLTLSNLAEDINVNPHHLSQIINSELGKSFATYINEFRINKACELLVMDSRKSVLEIALESGFSSKSSFNTLFKKQTSLTPSNYRKKFNNNGNYLCA